MTTTLRRLPLLASLAAALALFCGTAHAAQGDDTSAPGAPIHPSERTSWTLSIAGGMADLHTYPKGGSEILQSGNGVALDFGRAINQRLMVEGLAELVNAGGSTTHGLYGGAIQYYFTQRLWVRGGIGAANYKFKATDPATGATTHEDRWTPGASAGLGIEWMQFRKLSLDAQLDWMGAAYSSKTKGDFQALNVAAMIGVRWYGP